MYIIYIYYIYIYINVTVKFMSQALTDRLPGLGCDTQSPAVPTKSEPLATFQQAMPGQGGAREATCVDRIPTYNDGQQKQGWGKDLKENGIQLTGEASKTS